MCEEQYKSAPYMCVNNGLKSVHYMHVSNGVQNVHNKLVTNIEHMKFYHKLLLTEPDSK